MSLKDLMTAAVVGNESDAGRNNTVAVAAVDTTLLESQVASGEAAQEMRETENLIIVGEQIETHLTTLEGLGNDIATVCQDGMTTREAALVQSQINRYNDVVPAPFQVNIPSNESFSAAQRVTQTQVGVESIKSKAQDLGKWMSEMLTKLIEQMQKWIAKFFGGAEKLKSWAESTAKKAADFEPEDAKKKVTISTKMLSKGATAPTKASVASDVKDFADKATLIDSEYSLNKDAFDAAVKAAEKSTAKDAVAEISGNYKDKANKLTEESSVKEGDVIGGKFVKVADGKRTVATSETKPSKDDVELEILIPSDVVKVAESIEKMCDVIIDSKKLYGANKKIKDDAVKAADSVNKMLADDKTGSDEKTALRKHARDISAHAQAVVASGVHIKWASHSLSVAQAAAGYCNKSL